jgi:hypothetical protein
VRTSGLTAHDQQGITTPAVQGELAL